jgi:phosphatidylserine/phosphatidylglycerophosphate/cardiolipin synthase-like enzyme
MTEKEFYELLIQVIRRDNYIRKNELLELLKSSNLSCDKTYQFTRNKWNHYQEYIYITTTPANLINLMNHKTYLEKKIVSIYPVNDDYEWEFWGLEIKPGKVEANEYVNQEIHFEDIESQIIESIANAKYIIWIAMAWFTNRKIYSVLIDKKKQGLNIQMVLDDNAKNHNTDFKLEDEFEVYWVKIQSRYTNIMHDKFCIIDLNKVIHGTFNWTNAANYNKETISIDENKVTARTFADEFMRLKLSEFSE